MSILGINNNHDLKMVAKKSKAIKNNKDIAFSQSSFKILVLYFVQAN